MPPRWSTRPLSRTLAVYTPRLDSNVCPSCAFAKSIRVNHTDTRSAPRIRNASTLSSSTAVSASKDIPPALTELHKSLDALKRDAPGYVNLSRLQLALRGLESATPTIRIAVLGLQNSISARRLARLLVADPLTAEGGWEKKLEELSDAKQGSLLLRYGEDVDLLQPGTLVSTLHVPSHILKRYNLEVLVSSINLDGSDSGAAVGLQQLKDIALIPTAATPRSFSGGMSFVTYPVHRALVVADGLAGCFTLGRYTLQDQSQTAEEDNALQMVVNLPEHPLAESELAHAPPNVSIIDLPLAGKALSAFRASVTNATYYEQNWFRSNLPALTNWFTSSPTTPTAIQPVISTYISNLITDTSAALAADESAAAATSASLSIPTTVTNSLTSSIATWAETSHAELRDSLSAALSSPRSGWRRLKWWKLPWRADDVGMHLADILERAWLVEAEKSLVFLAGRGAQAGLLDLQPPAVVTPALGTPLQTDTGVIPPTPAADSPAISPDAIAATSKPHPWASQISLARKALLTRTVPAMQETAQALLLQTASISGVGGALAALLYMSVPTASVYEVGAVAALGIVVALRRLQKRWEGERRRWEGEVREVGRETLREAEAEARAAVLRGGVVDVDPGARQDREVARRAVERARVALDAVRDGSAA